MGKPHHPLQYMAYSISLASDVGSGRRHTRNKRKNLRYSVDRSEIESKTVEARSIAYGAIVLISKDQLGKKEVSAKWVPRLLTIYQKQNHMTSKECLALFNLNLEEFLGRFLKLDKIWIHYNPPETNKQLSFFRQTGAEETHGGCHSTKL